MYVDEAGDHGGCTEAETRVGSRYLCLLGVVIDQGNSYTELERQLNELKEAHLQVEPENLCILHREDILHKRGAFHLLRDDACRSAFDDGLISWIQNGDFRMISIVIDKATHGAKTYRALTHPYHYCLEALLERYCGFLEQMKAVGDVMAEARGRSEDKALAQRFRQFYRAGSAYTSMKRAQETLTTSELKLKNKAANITGLQLADVLAHPIKRDTLVAYGKLESRGGPYADRIAAAVANKYNCHFSQGQVRGYGQKLLV